MAYSGTMEERSEKKRAYCLANPEKIKAWTIKSQSRNKEKIKARQLKYRIENREKLREKNRKYYTQNPEKIKAGKRKYHINNQRKIKNDKLKGSYGITVEDYERMYLEQWGMCAICGTQKKSSLGGRFKRGEILCVDHCHNSEKVRLLLCSKCNLLLGYAGIAGDDIFVLQNAIDYIEYHNNRKE